MADLEVSTHIDASPEKVWALMGDPTRIPEFSPEVQRVTWIGGATGPAIGARFRGSNRLGWHRWSTTCEVVAYELGREIAWNVSAGGVPISRWGYLLAVAGEGVCRLTETFDDRRPGIIRFAPVSFVVSSVRGVRDITGHNRAGMEQTLAAIKAAAESERAQTS